MELKEAIEHLIGSEQFKAKAKQKNGEGAKYRMFLARHKKDELKNGAVIDFLLDHSYRVDVRTPLKIQKNG
ncbi:hypothetical protein [Asinibacterium sp. OR53]|uniref:hypothetical protein n=1 Tax=Asinibacterium sp. OR53 TaxID=925409 RepID=UPI00047EF109|nr:hypothetical protein [Asinibacterium sp. OR53]